MTFADAIAFVLEWEQEHSSDEKGGDTWWGIARNYHLDVTPWPPTKEQVLVIYKSQYWDPCRCDELPDALRLAVFDAAVNTGPGLAIRFLQRGLAVKADGVIGPATLRAAALAGVDALGPVLTARVLYYGGADGFSLYGRGWIARAFDVMQFSMTGHHR